MSLLIHVEIDRRLAIQSLHTDAYLLIETRLIAEYPAAVELRWLS
jgi:hypothetical protein